MSKVTTQKFLYTQPERQVQGHDEQSRMHKVGGGTLFILLFCQTGYSIA